MKTIHLASLAVLAYTVAALAAEQVALTKVLGGLYRMRLNIAGVRP